MGEIDRQYLDTPFFGSRRMKAWLDRRGMPVSRSLSAPDTLQTQNRLFRPLAIASTFPKFGMVHVVCYFPYSAF